MHPPPPLPPLPPSAGSMVLAGARPEESPPIQVDWKVGCLRRFLPSLLRSFPPSLPPFSGAPPAVTFLRTCTKPSLLPSLPPVRPPFLARCPWRQSRAWPSCPCSSSTSDIDLIKVGRVDSHGRGRKGGREGAREGGSEGGRERERENVHTTITRTYVQPCPCSIVSSHTLLRMQAFEPSPNRVAFRSARARRRRRA